MTKLVAITQGAGELINKNAQEVIGYITRVSNPSNQMNFETVPKLLKYCIANRHWSPFEHAFMTVEIKTSRAIAAQILRHRSFFFQEYSQRYSASEENIVYPARRQDLKNRQNSIDDMSEETKIWFEEAQKNLWNNSQSIYQEALRKGIAKEQARFLLPLNTSTCLYMSGNTRSWLHYIELRCDKATQKEHRDIADGCKAIFIEQFPDVARAMEWV
jgi:thymidylate synthase (FAD)